LIIFDYVKKFLHKKRVLLARRKQMDIIGQLLIINERRQKALLVRREQLCLSAYRCCSLRV